MIYGSVCSGVEGASLAFQPLGWQCAFVADVDPFACHLLNQRFDAARPQFMPDPAAPGLTPKEANRRRANIKGVAKLPAPGGNHLSNFGDLAQHESWPIQPGAIDLLIGGTPCQDFSVAGLGAGITGARGQLTIEFVRLLERLRPRWFVFENVPGILSNDEGRAFGMFLGLVAGVGYGFAYRVLDAQYFALAQRRERVFVVGHLGDWRRAAAVLFDRESMLRNPPPRRGEGQNAARTLTGGTSGGGGYRGPHPDTTLIPEVGHALNTRATRQEPQAETLLAYNLTPSNSNKDFNARESDRAQSLMTKGGAPSARGGDVIVTGQPIAFSCKDHGQDASEDVSPTLRSMNEVNGNANGGGQMAVAYGIRADAGREGVAKTANPDAEGRVRKRDPGFNVNEELAPTIDASAPHTVVYPILEPGARTGVSTTDKRVSDGIGDAGDPMYTLQAGHAHGIVSLNARQHPITDEDVTQPLDTDGASTAIAFQTRVARNGRGNASDIVPAPTGVDAGDTSDMRPCVAIFKPSHFTRDKDGAPSDTHPPLSADADKGDQDPVLFDGVKVRRLTPLEYERLQGYPDNWTLIQYRGRPAADSPRYKACGNGYAANVVRVIGERIDMVDKL